MPRFKTKIDTSDSARVYHADELNWCLRQVEANLRAFKAEFMRRYGIGGGIPARQILNDMLPDPPAAPVNDDARDAARWRFLLSSMSRISHSPDGCADYIAGIDAAMEREAK